MDKKEQRTLAWVLIGIGAVYFVANLTNFNMSRIFWPLVLVIVGGILVFRPQIFRINSGVILAFVRELNLDGDWTVENKEYMNFVGDFDLDMREASIPVGETEIRMSGFVNEVKIWVPDNVGIRVDTNAFVTESKPFDDEEQTFILSGMHYHTDGYEQAEKKIRLEINCFVAEVRLM